MGSTMSTDPCPQHHVPACHECAVHDPRDEMRDVLLAVSRELRDVLRERNRLAMRLDDVTNERDHQRERRADWTKRAQELSAEVERLRAALREIDAAESWHTVIRVCRAALGDEGST